MSGSPSAIISMGYGSWGSVGLVVTMGYGIGAAAVVPGDRCEFTMPRSVPQYTMPASRPDYTVTR